MRVGPARDLRLFRGQVLPRLKELLKHWAPWTALILAGVIAVAAQYLPGGSLKISEVAGVGFTFASIATGACVAALVLSLGLPGASRLRKWATYQGSTEGKSALSDLVFVLAWAALAQIALIAVCVLAELFGAGLPVAPAGMIASHGVGLWLGLSVFLYALFELVVVVITLIQMGVLIIAEEQKAANDYSATDPGEQPRNDR